MAEAVIEVVTAECFYCTEAGTVHLTPEQYDRWQAGSYIQESLPDVTPEVREQLITGVHPECWAAMFPDEEEEDDG